MINDLFLIESHILKINVLELLINQNSVKTYIERKKYRRKKTRKEHRERKEQCARYRDKKNEIDYVHLNKFILHRIKSISQVAEN